VTLPRRSSIFVALFALLAGCGYYFPHVYTGPARSIYMPTWKNQTNQLDLDTKLYRELTLWFQKSSSIEITKTREKADLILAGEIMSIDLPSLAFNVDARATSVKINLMVRFVLKDLASGEIIWEEPGRLWTQDYALGSGGVISVDNENRALEKILQDMSEQIYIGSLSRLRRKAMKKEAAATTPVAPPEAVPAATEAMPAAK